MEGEGERRIGEAYPLALARVQTCSLLRSASGPEVKGSAIRRGIGNYSPERGRALVTFITELSASLGKQCASFNPPVLPPSISPPHTPVLHCDSVPSCAIESTWRVSLCFSLILALLSRADMGHHAVPSSHFTLERNQRPI